MGLNRDVIALLDGCGNRHRTWTTTNSLALKLSIFQLLVHELRVVGSDVDISGIKLPQLVNVSKQLLGACPFQGWQNLKREPSALLILMDKFRYAHSEKCIFGCKVTKKAKESAEFRQKSCIFAA